MGAPAAVLLIATHVATIAAAPAVGPPPWPDPAISFWYDCSGCSGAQPDWPPLLAKVAAHRAQITSIILFCGVKIEPGGIVAGLNRWNTSACATQLVPGILALGVRVEIGIESGTSDANDYRGLFSNSTQPLAEHLAFLGRAHGLSGWNMDLEPQKGQPASVSGDAVLYAGWARKVRLQLHAAGLRFTAAVADWGPMIAQYPVLSSGFDRIMDMSTYNAPSMAAWLGRFQHFANSTPRRATSVGLGCWIDKTTNMSGVDHWSATPASAAERICHIKNASIPEISFWVLGPHEHTGQKPEEFWWAALSNYMADGGCLPQPLPPDEVCPATLPHSHRAAPGGCCVASYTPACGEKCEEAACNATALWRWKYGLNFSHDLYTCCPETPVQKKLLQ
eukprot:SAG31_NODE_1789_length_7236_cov_7.210607_9_plen_392_part_00